MPELGQTSMNAALKQENDELRARIAELEAVADGRGLTHTIEIAPGLVVYGNAEAADALQGALAVIEKAKAALGL